MSCKREGPGGPSRFLWASLSASGYVSGRAACNRSCVACGDAYLWVADPRQVTFLCLSKEKSPKEKTPRSRRLPPALLGKIGARLTRRAHTTRLGLEQKTRFPRFSLRCLAAATELEQHLALPDIYFTDLAEVARAMPAKLGTGGFPVPVARAEYRSPTGSFQASPCSSRAAYSAADELASARWGEERKGMSRAPGRAFFGFFLCTSKERNPPAVRGTAIITSPQATQKERRGSGVGNTHAI